MYAVAILLLLQAPTPQQRATLASLGWPPAPPVIPVREDLVLRRGASPPLAGSLSELHAFAAVKTARGTGRIPRDDIAFILLNGRLIPAEAPPLPEDSDAVLLTNGRDMLVGRVEVDGETIHVNARTVQQSEVALIHLKDPKFAARQQAEESGQSHGAATTGARSTGSSPVGSAASARPIGPDQVPWGKGIWRGTVRFTIDEPGDPGESAQGSYEVTFSEEPAGVVAGRRPTQIKLHPLSLAYQYDWTIDADPRLKCGPFHVTKSGSGFDGVDSTVRSEGLLNLELLPGSRVGNENAGTYQVNVFSPAQVAVSEMPVNCSGPPEPHSSGAASDLGVLPNALLESQSTALGCRQSQPVFRAPPPYLTIAGDLTCEHKTFRWHLDRGGPATAGAGMPQDRCETARGMLTLSTQQRATLLAQFQRLRDEFAKTQADEARLRRTRDQLQDAFDLLLVSAAGANVGKRLLELVTGDDMLETAASTGQITAAEQQFVKDLNEFIELYKTWTEISDNAGEWGESLLADSVRGRVISKEHQEVIDGAIEMFTIGQVLVDAIGQGDGKAAGDFIDENLGALGPLVPEYALSKGRQYVQVSEQWAEGMKDLARLAREGMRLAGQIAESGVGVKARGRELERCLAM